MSTCEYSTEECNSAEDICSNEGQGEQMICGNPPEDTSAWKCGYASCFTENNTTEQVSEGTESDPEETSTDQLSEGTESDPEVNSTDQTSEGTESGTEQNSGDQVSEGTESDPQVECDSLMGECFFGCLTTEEMSEMEQGADCAFFEKHVNCLSTCPICVREELSKNCPGFFATQPTSGSTDTQMPAGPTETINSCDYSPNQCNPFEGDEGRPCDKGGPQDPERMICGNPPDKFLDLACGYASCFTEENTYTFSQWHQETFGETESEYVEEDQEECDEQMGECFFGCMTQQEMSEMEDGADCAFFEKHVDCLRKCPQKCVQELLNESCPDLFPEVTTPSSAINDNTWMVEAAILSVTLLIMILY